MATTNYSGPLVRDSLDPDLTVDRGLRAGERRASDPSTSYQVVSANVIPTPLTTGNGEKAIGGGAAVKLHGILINAALSNNFTIKGMRDEAGAAVDWVIPATTNRDYIPGVALEFPAGLIVQKGHATADDGKLVVLWSLL